jgi:hypothetical protein
MFKEGNIYPVHGGPSLSSEHLVLPLRSYTRLQVRKLKFRYDKWQATISKYNCVF